MDWTGRTGRTAGTGRPPHFLTAFQGQQLSHLIQRESLLNPAQIYVAQVDTTTHCSPLHVFGYYTSLAITLLWPLLFSGHYTSLAIALLWPSSPVPIQHFYLFRSISPSCGPSSAC